MIATLPREILLPRRVEFPAWVRNLGEPLKMFGHGAFGKPFAQPMGGAGAAANPLLILDQFTDTNGTSLASHTIAPTNNVSASWAVTGTMTIQSNKASAGPGSNLSLADSTVAEVEGLATCVGDGSVGSFIGVILRAQDANNLWLGGFSGSGYTIYQRAGGFTIRASGAATFGNGTSHTVKFTATGTLFTLDIDNGTYTLSYSSSTLQTQTKVGVYINSNSLVQTIDDFTVTSL